MPKTICICTTSMILRNGGDGIEAMKNEAVTASIKTNRSRDYRINAVSFGNKRVRSIVNIIENGLSNPLHYL